MKDAVRAAKARERGTVIESDQNVYAKNAVVSKRLGEGNSARGHMRGMATLNCRVMQRGLNRA